MTTSLGDKAAQNAQRAAMLRVLGGVSLAFLALLTVAASLEAVSRGIAFHDKPY